MSEFKIPNDIVDFSSVAESVAEFINSSKEAPFGYKDKTNKIPNTIEDIKERERKAHAVAANKKNALCDAELRPTLTSLIQLYYRLDRAQKSCHSQSE